MCLRRCCTGFRWRTALLSCWAGLASPDSALLTIASSETIGVMKLWTVELKMISTNALACCLHLCLRWNKKKKFLFFFLCRKKKSLLDPSMVTTVSVFISSVVVRNGEVYVQFLFDGTGWFSSFWVVLFRLVKNWPNFFFFFWVSTIRQSRIATVRFCWILYGCMEWLLTCSRWFLRILGCTPSLTSAKLKSSKINQKKISEQ